MAAALWILALLAALYALHRLCLRMEGRGWIYYLRKQGTADRAGTAMLAIQQLLEPSKRHVLEIKREDKRQEAGSGDPPAPGA